jgi:hypothetical protein
MSSKSAAETTTTPSGASSIAPRSPARLALKAAIERRDGLAEALAEKHKKLQEVDSRLAASQRELRQLNGEDTEGFDPGGIDPDDAVRWGMSGEDLAQAVAPRRKKERNGRDYSDVDALVRGAVETQQKIAVSQASIVILERAVVHRGADVKEAEDRLGLAERAVEKAARLVLAGGFAPLLDGLAEMQAEVSRRRWALKFLLGNAARLNGSGGTDEARRARTLLCDGLLPAPDTPANFDDGVEDEWKLTFEQLAFDADTELPV